MKKIYYLFTFFVLITCFISQSSLAGENGEKIDAFFKKGIHFETTDGNYSLTFNPLIQVKYSFSNREGPANDAQSLMIRRTYISMFGNALTKDLTYFIRLSLTPGATAANVLEYSWLNYRFIDAVQIQTGVFKLPFSRQELASSEKLQFVDRSLANARYNIGRSVTFMIHGESFEKKLEYYLAVANGRGTGATLNANQEMAYIGRLVFNPLGEYGTAEGDAEYSDTPAISVGIAGELHNEETTVSPTQDRVMAGTADFGIKYKGFSFEAAGFYSSTNPGGAVPAVADFGYYAEAGYFFIPKKFEFAVRASSLFDDINNKGGGVYFNNGSITGLGGVNDGVDELGDSANEHEFSAVLNYHFKPNKIKWQAQYTYMLDGQAGTNITNHILMSQMQVEF